METGSGKEKKSKGRPKGSANVATKQGRKIVLDVVEDLGDQLRAKFDELEPKEWIHFYCKLLDYCFPRYAPMPPAEPLRTEEEEEELKKMFEAAAIIARSQI